MNSAEFAVPVAQLDAAGKDLHFPVRAAWLRGALEDFGEDAQAAGPDGTLDVRLSKSGADVVVQGRVHAELVVPCARCLKPARLPIEKDLVALMVPAGVASSRNMPPSSGSSGSGAQDASADVTFATNEPDIVPFDGETVVLDDLVRDELVLEIPMIPLCSEDCPGMSALPTNADEGDPGVDPRLAPLLRIKLNKA
jgi:uncharacterized protein